ncbi:protein phosphatase [Catenibacillus scindens]|uniref:Protein phosphatase n=1 Tax=Catenibacillus scindens TaxID=673271 RepID=A0A7W8H9N6_9FIRM|nr:Stp1/IreP family PP2C-type Ser/Thr phosphatase [Catenibacillus scindens]MBB5264464.1 protein phosphatase [Catenibacillus scindens]
MRVFGRSDIGSVRKMNQDFMYFSKEPVGQLPNLFIVADGMGGHKAGDYASRMSVENFIDYMMKAPPDTPIRVVDDGIHYINELVLEKARQHSELSGMGTTFVAAFIMDQTLYVANVGDSRLYLVDSEIHQVTEDHSYVGAMVRAGEITTDEARHHPDKNIITRAIGASWDIRVDFFEVDLQPGDRILMCSDGLSNMVDDPGLLEIITNTPMEKVTDALIDEAKANGGLDNITAIVIDPFNEEVD